MSSSFSVLVSTRSVVVLCRWAIRYSRGRLTGIYSTPLALVSEALPHMTAAERALLREEAEDSRRHVARPSTIMSPSEAADEELDWRRLLERIDAVEGEGDEQPTACWSGSRVLALTAIGAMRVTCSYSWGEPVSDEDQQGVADACRDAAPAMSPADRVLMLRDLNEAAQEHERMDARVAACWTGLYDSVRGMELDEDYARMNRLPDTIAR